MSEKPKNYESIVKFAEQNGMYPANFLGKVWYGDIILEGKMPPNVTLNIRGSIKLECVKIGCNTTIHAAGEITSTTLRAIPARCKFSSCGCIIFASVRKAKTLHVEAKGCIEFFTLNVLPKKSKLISGSSIALRKCYNIEENVIIHSSSFVNLWWVFVIYSGVKISGISADVFNLSTMHENVTFNVEDIEFYNLKYIPKRTVLDVSKTLKLYSVTKIESDVVFNVNKVITYPGDKIKVVW